MPQPQNTFFRELFVKTFVLYLRAQKRKIHTQGLIKIMNSATIFGIIITAGLFIAIVYLFLKNMEYIACLWRGQIPFVPSARGLRRAVVHEINTHYPQMKTACDIGAGYGGLARKIARECNMDVTAIENMPLCARISKIGNAMSRAKCRTVHADAFEYLRTAPKFDIAVAYLGPGVNDRLAEFQNKFRVLITLDVPVHGLTPVRTIDAGPGATRYGREKYPHKLFVYEF